MQIALLPLLGVLFIGLKLGGVIAWSWLWVLCPLWIGLAIGGIAIIVFLATASMIEIRDQRRANRMFRCR